MLARPHPGIPPSWALHSPFTLGPFIARQLSWAVVCDREEQPVQEDRQEALGEE